jgi:hypothetical protein
MNNANIRTMVRGAYDIQRLRIQMGNRIVGNFKTKLGQAPGTPEEDLGDAEISILKTLRDDYKKITDGIKTFPRQTSFKGTEVISDYTELCLIAQYVDLELEESRHFSRLGNILKDYPIWTEFLEGVKGIGPAMAGVLISEIDIHKAKYPSCLWAYCGLDVAPDGKGRSRRKEHLVEVDYTDKEGNPAKRVGITFNPFVKTKVTGVLAPCLIRSANPKYGKIYRDYKHRIANMPVHAEKTPKHRDNMARRYMAKRFLVDLYIAWRTLEGLEVHPEYSEGKLGIVHTGS